MNYQNYESVAHATRLYQAGMERELKQFYAQVSEKLSAEVEGTDSLMPWLRQLSLQALPEDSASLPTSVYARSEGWLSYFCGNYVQAYEGFLRSISDEQWQSLAYDSALGLAKVYTRSGHWQSAKAWTLYYLSCARKRRDDFGLVKGYGALAEIFLRADHPQHALACFNIANQMMPSGQGQLDKQYNFIASALIRNGEYLRAETLLRNSMKLSKDKLARDETDVWAKVGYLHSCSRLCYLQLAASKPIQLSAEAHIWIEQVPIQGAKVPVGFIHTALAIQAIRSNQLSLALPRLYQALELFANVAPIEQQWVTMMIGQVQAVIATNDSGQEVDTPMTVLPSCQILLDIVPIAAPSIAITVDQIWEQVVVTNEGYQHLVTPQQTLQELMSYWRLFFI